MKKTVNVNRLIGRFLILKILVLLLQIGVWTFAGLASRHREGSQHGNFGKRQKKKKKIKIGFQVGKGMVRISDKNWPKWFG
jgi:hypothetical protein